MQGGATVRRRGRTAEGRAEVRRALTVAALELFDRRGYEATTVDDIAAAAGVARRTFFRYFRGKEDVVSPDHAGALARITQVFETAHPAEPTAAVALRAVETVLDMYLGDADTALRRFRLVRAVPPLRDREAAEVEHYRRLLTRHLRDRFVRYDGDDDGELRATVAASAVVAAHNLALKAWLLDGAPADGVAACRERFRRVAEVLPHEQGPPPRRLMIVPPPPDDRSPGR